MKVKCLHGYFIFEETKVGQLSDFVSLTGLTLDPIQNTRSGTGYTFSELLEAPSYSLAGKPFLDFPAIATFEGDPWEIFEANSCVFNFGLGLVVPISTIITRAPLTLAGNRLISPGLIMPGSLTDRGDKIKNYSAWYSRDTARWLYTEVEFV